MKVRDMVLQGWQYSNSEEFNPFQILQSELSVVQGCILRGNRVVVPPIEELHESHPGICRIQSSKNYMLKINFDTDGFSKCMHGYMIESCMDVVKYIIKI